MSQGTILIVLGIITALAPFLGFPLSWIEILLPVVGLMVAIIGYLLLRSGRTNKTVISIPEELS